MSNERSASASLRPVLSGVLLDIAPALIAYYGLRAVGTSEYVALLTATVVAGLKISYDAIRARRLDPFAGFLMLNFGLSLIVGISTSDARLLMAGNTLVGALSGLIFLGSCVIGTPLTQVVAQRVHPVDDEPEPGQQRFVHRLHVRLSAMWGVGLLLIAGLQLAVVFSQSVDIANGVNMAISLTVTALLIVVTLLVSRRARSRAERRNSTQG